MKKNEKKSEKKSWAIVELMGHVRMAGVLSEEERFGVKLGRLDIPQGQKFVTQYFGGQSVYRITPCTESTARAVALVGVPAPVQAWELPKPSGPAAKTKLISASAATPDAYDYGEEPF